MFESNGMPVEKLVSNDILGQVVFSKAAENRTLLREMIDVSGWKKGYYQISLFTGQKLYQKLIIIQ